MALPGKDPFYRSLVLRDFVRSSWIRVFVRGSLSISCLSCFSMLGVFWPMSHGKEKDGV